MLAGADRQECLAAEGELDDGHGARGPARRLGGQRRDAVDARIGEHAGIEPGSLLGLTDVPQVRNDLLNGGLAHDGTSRLNGTTYDLGLASRHISTAYVL